MDDLTSPQGVDPGDLEACAREPIHLPGTIQPHGVLLAFEGAGRILTRASANAAALLGRADGIPFGASLGEVLAGAPWHAVHEALERSGPLQERPSYLCMVGVGGADHQAIAHGAAGGLILELERMPPLSMPAEMVYGIVRDAADRLQTADSIEALCAQAAAEFRRLTGFDRVMVYRFDEAWHGTVVAEDRNDRLPSYLDLRFPASDIPQQARELYRLNRIRLIPDATYAPVPILDPPGTAAAPLDLSFSVLRSVSPVHLEYMRNMGTPASMSISVVVEGRLWALVSCHHAEPRQVPFAVRLACDFLGQMFSTYVAALIHAGQSARRARLQGVQSRLLTEMAASDPFIDGLVRVPQDLLLLTGAQGAAVVEDGRCRLVGETPGEKAVLAIADHLSASRAEVFHTDCLAGHLPGAEAWKDKAAGVLAIAISKLHPSFIMWFRPEVVQTVRWGGDPSKPVASSPSARIHPRRSFEAWKEIVRLRSDPWRDTEVEAADALRNAIVGIVLRKAEELAQLTEELERSNKELEAFSYSVSHDLRAPFRHIVGYTELLKEKEAAHLTDKGRRYIEVILDSARSAGTLVDSLLNFSRMGRAHLTPVEISMRAVVDDALRMLEPDTVGRDIQWILGELPTVRGDPTMLRIAWQNLLSNAIKYTRPRSPAVIEIGHRPGTQEHVFFVRDNGVGFDMAYAGKLFGVFQRLHRAEDFDGIGIGLANVRRIAERHGGRSWAEGAPDMGATFYFSLPASSVQD